MNEKEKNLVDFDSIPITLLQEVWVYFFNCFCKAKVSWIKLKMTPTGLSFEFEVVSPIFLNIQFEAKDIDKLVFLSEDDAKKANYIVENWFS